MPKDPHKAKRPRDPNQLAKLMVDIAAGEADDAPTPERGRAGGLVGGKARARSLTPEQRKEIARKAAATRWNKG